MYSIKAGEEDYVNAQLTAKALSGSKMGENVRADGVPTGQDCS